MTTMRSRAITIRMFTKMRAKFNAHIKAAVADYLDRLPDDTLVRLAPRIMGAAGLTETQYKRLVETAKGDVVVKIYFANGDMATISQRGAAERSGPGW